MNSNLHMRVVCFYAKIRNAHTHSLAQHNYHTVTVYAKLSTKYSITS